MHDAEVTETTLIYCIVQGRWVRPERRTYSGGSDGEQDRAPVPTDQGKYDEERFIEHALARMADEGCPNHDDEE